MIYGLYQSAAGMMTNEYRQNVIANNLANSQTVGFKRDIPIFSERLRESMLDRYNNPTNDLMESLSGGMWLGRTSTDFSDGPLSKTGNPLDVALEGPGFLMVQVDGRQLLTRDGRMMTDEFGRLVSVSDGAAILNRAGSPIVLDRNGGEITITSDGRIQQDGREVARLGLTDVEDYRTLRKHGNGRFISTSDERIEAVARVHAGFVESSAVRPVHELTGMIESSRAFQINARMVSLQDEMLGRLVNQVPRI